MANKTIVRPNRDRLALARFGLDNYLQELNDWLLAEDEAGRKTSADAARTILTSLDEILIVNLNAPAARHSGAAPAPHAPPRTGNMIFDRMMLWLGVGTIVLVIVVCSGMLHLGWLWLSGLIADLAHS
jgi:hypothetical protein